MKRKRGAHVGPEPRKLWLPSQEAAADEGPEIEALAGASTGGPAEASEGEDDLDRLLNQYEAQAAEDLQRVRGAEQRPAGKLSATQRREAALEQPLAPDNKGFQMLAAMGHRQGQGLGKSVAGRTEPVPLELKQDRLGLGRVNKKATAREAQRQRERQAAERLEQAKHAAEASIHAGRQRTAEQFAARREAAQLRKAQQVCESLDTAAGVASNYLWQPPSEEDATAPAEPLHHPLHSRPPAGAVAAGRGSLGALAGAADDELLEEGESFRRDMTGPGQEEEGEAAREARRYAGASAGRGPGDRPAALEGRLERAAPAAAADGGAEAAAVAAAAWHQLSVQQRLQDVLGYLRERYQYCLYCGCRFQDAADLYEHCPGLLEADHD